MCINMMFISKPPKPSAYFVFHCFLNESHEKCHFLSLYMLMLYRWRINTKTHLHGGYVFSVGAPTSWFLLIMFALWSFSSNRQQPLVWFSLKTLSLSTLNPSLRTKKTVLLPKDLLSCQSTISDWISARSASWHFRRTKDRSELKIRRLWSSPYFRTPHMHPCLPGSQRHLRGVSASLTGPESLNLCRMQTRRMPISCIPVL